MSGEVINPAETTKAGENQPGGPGEPNAEVKIPKERLDQEIAKRKSLEEQLASLQRERDELKKQGGHPQPSAPAPHQPEDLAAVKAQLQQIELKEQRRELAAALQLNGEQAEFVQSFVQKGLKPAAALAAARAENAALFGGNDQRGFQPGTHGALRPMGNGAPPPQTMKDRLKEIQKLPLDQRMDAHAQATGIHLAKSLGWERKNG